jgi:hypothetical protein
MVVFCFSAIIFFGHEQEGLTGAGAACGHAPIANSNGAPYAAAVRDRAHLVLILLAYALITIGAVHKIENTFVATAEPRREGFPQPTPTIDDNFCCQTMRWDGGAVIYYRSMTRITL